MLRYKDFSLIKPNSHQINQISNLIIDDNGSVFHGVELNKIVENNFGTELFYFVDNPANMTCFSPIHVDSNKYGFKRYNFMPLGDIPYAGFVGKQEININNLSIGFFESIKYCGFPYAIDTIHKHQVESFGETNMVDLSLDEDEIFTKIIHSKRRNMIRKALKSGVTIKVYSNQEGFEKFWPLLESLHIKLGYKRFTFDYYNAIFQYFAKKQDAFVLLAFKEEKPISGIFIIGNKNYMHYYKGASLSQVKNEGQGELMQWEAIKLSKSLGIKYYDLCNLDKNNLPAIYKFKTGISQNIVNYPKFSKNRLGYKIFNKF